MTDSSTFAKSVAMKAALKIAKAEAQKLHEKEYTRAISLVEGAARRGEMKHFFFDCYWKSFDCIEERLRSDEFQIQRKSGGWTIIWQHWKGKLAPGSTACCEAARICMMAEEALIKFQQREDHLRATVVDTLMQRVDQASDAGLTEIKFKWDEFKLDYEEKEVVTKLVRGMRFCVEENTRALAHDYDEYVDTSISWRHLVEEAKKLITKEQLRAS